MLNINFHLRSLTEKKPQSIFAVFYVENSRIRIFTNQKITPSDWSKDKQKAKSNDKLNKLLKEQAEFIENYVENLKIKKKRFYKNELEITFNSHFKIGSNLPQKEGEIVDFVSFVEDYVKRKDIKIGTRKQNNVTRMHIYYCFNIVSKKLLKQWKAMKKPEKKANPDFLLENASKQIDFDQIDYSFIEQFHNYLLTETYTRTIRKEVVTENYSKNFIAKQVNNIQQFGNAAVAKGLITNLSFQTYDKATYEDADAIHLSWSDIDKLKALELDPYSTHGKIRNLFVFNCYLGLRYSDLYKLDKNRFSEKDNQLFLKIRMRKTQDLLNFPILNSAEAIMKLYNYELPVVSDANFNEEIKKICLKAGITELQTKRVTKGQEVLYLTIPKYLMVSTHTARRSFATNFYEDKVPIKELMAVTGHTTEASFKNYVRSKLVEEFAGFLAIGANR